MTRNTVGAIRVKYQRRNDPYALGIQMLMYYMADNLGIIMPHYRERTKPVEMPGFISAKTPEPVVPDMIVFDINSKNQIGMLTRPEVQRPSGYDMVLLSTLMKNRQFNMIMVGIIKPDDTDYDSWKFALDLAAQEAVEIRCKKRKTRAFWPVIKRIGVFTTGLLLEWTMLNSTTGETMDVPAKVLAILREEFNKYDGWNMGETHLLALQPLLDG
jgi:hypothetical protein